MSGLVLISRGDHPDRYRMHGRCDLLSALTIKIADVILFLESECFSKHGNMETFEACRPGEFLTAVDILRCDVEWAGSIPSSIIILRLRD